jgi:GST-like protein
MYPSALREDLSPMIDLHYVATPNGQKISIMVEECGLDCTIIPYDIFEGEQHTAEFGQIRSA